MNTEDIEKALINHKLTQECFEGVFASNRIPDTLGKGKACVINTQPSHLPGEHWYAVYRDTDGILRHFDSYGIVRKLKWTGPVVHTMKWRVQGTVPICGLYTLLFILTMNAPWTFDLNWLDSTVDVNDKIVIQFCRREFGLQIYNCMYI